MHHSIQVVNLSAIQVVNLVSNFSRNPELVDIILHE